MPHYFRVGLTSLGALALLASCASGIEHETAPPPPASDAEALFQTVGDFEAPLLADGVITDSEREAARAHLITCLQSTGAEVELEGQGESIDDVVAIFDDTPEALYGHDRCRASVSTVESVWILHNATTPEQMAELEAETLVCSRHSGAEVTSFLDLTEEWNNGLHLENEAVGLCIDAYNLAVKVPIPGLQDELDRYLTRTGTS